MIGFIDRNPYSGYETALRFWFPVSATSGRFNSKEVMVAFKIDANYFALSKEKFIKKHRSQHAFYDASGRGVRVQLDDRFGNLQVTQLDNAGEKGKPLHSIEVYWMEILPDAADVKISLTWDDPPAAENALKALVNDLDIVVYDPKGKRYFPWTLNPTDPSAAAVRTREDDVNNVEQVFIESAALYPGIWQVLVKGKHVPEGPQIFSVTSSVKMHH